MKNHFLSKLIWKLTGVPRYVPEGVRWSGSSPLYNAFRALELAFGRSMSLDDRGVWSSIRCESSLVWGVDRKTGRTVSKQTNHTFEAKVIYAEQEAIKAAMSAARALKRLIPKVSIEYVPYPFFTGIGAQRQMMPYKLAIAFDNGAVAGTRSSPSSPQSVAFTNSGNMIFCGVVCFSSTTTGSVGASYNGASFTQISASQESSGRFFGNFYLLGPSTGSNTLSFTYSAAVSSDLAGAAASYSGVAQSGQPDSHAENYGSPVTTLSKATTVVASNCWVVGAFRDGGNSTLTLGTGINATRANTGASLSLDFVLKVGDSNGTVSTGSYSMSISTTSGDELAIRMASFSPAAAVASGAGLFPQMAGI